MGWLIVSVIVFIWLMLMGFLHLQGRYRYAARSRRALRVEAIAAVALALVIVRSALGFLNAYLTAAAVVALSVPIFLAFALATVELWRKVKQRGFDEQIARLEAREARSLDEVRVLSEAILEADREERAAEDGRARAREDQEQWREWLDTWQKGGGAARVRSLRVEEWKHEAGSLDRSELERRAQDLERRLEEEVAEDEEARLRAQLAVYRAELRRTGAASAGHRESEPVGELKRLLSRRDGVREEIRRVQEELAEWRRRREKFLSGRITLD